MSFNPRETPDLALATKAEYLKRYGRAGAAEGWHFLTGPEESIKALTQAVGFEYQYDPKTDQYAHATAIMLLTPDGRVAQYYYGVEFAPKDLRLGLIQAASGKIGNLVDEVLLYCYHYDPAAGRYGAVITQNSETFGDCDHPRARRDGMDLIPHRIPAARPRDRTGRIAMFDNFPLWPQQASAGAANVDALYVFLLVLSAFMCVAIFSLILVFAVKYHRRPGVAAEQIEGSTSLEVTWSVIPMVIFLFIFAWGALIYFQERTPPQGAAEVYVVAKQWMWKVQHEEGQREINELHVPVGRDVKLVMTSQDVIHSFYVPAFRIKQDVLPGRYTTAWFHATKPGTYQLFCAQYCGTSHSGMIGQVVVMEPADYQAWLGGGPVVPLAANGEKLFRTWAASAATALIPRAAGRT